MKRLILTTTLICALPALAQQSAGYQLTEHTFNQGGRPQDGVAATSTSFAITLDAIGDTTGFAEPTSASYGVTPGFVTAFGPAGEVLDLTFDDATTISWDEQPNATGYNIYSHDLGSLSGTDNGGCLESTVPDNSYMAVGTPAATEGFFYLVTAINRLAEEGTPGSDSQGTERGNAGACP